MMSSPLFLLASGRRHALHAFQLHAFDFYHKKSVDESSIIVVISPLTALIKDQVRALKKHGVCCEYVDSDSDVAVVNKGVFKIVFMCPKLLVGKWRSLFVSDMYKKRLVGLIV